MYKLKIFLISGPRHPLWRVPWATILYTFQHNKKGRNEKLLDTMLFKLMKKMRKDFFYESNIRLALIFHKWKVVLNNLTLGVPNFFFFCKIQYIHIYYMISHLNCILCQVRKKFRNRFFDSTILTVAQGTRFCTLTYFLM